MKSEINVENTIYRNVDFMTCYMNPEDYTFSMTNTYNSSHDEIPNGLYWIHDDLSGMLYAYDTYEGYFILSGEASSGNSFELGNYPY